ncbi:MAG: PQQ-dependent sugar dehydrogenase [Taibaiella sp.]|nr:PQQ-dependent sugar dehydrogenase [Taibaiella sp.]
MRTLYILLLVAIASCQQASSQMTTRVVANNLFIPWEMVYAPDDHIWFTQKNGYICRVEPATGVVDTLYYESNTVVSGEGGMLGMALHPNFPTDPYVYVAYDYSQGGYKERIARYTYNGTQLGSPMTLLDNIAANTYHNGCRLVIVNGQLYITTGDAGTTANSQNLSSINGKTLRINLDGSIPSDNPIPGSPVWSWGHRNAQGLVYANSRFYSSEHGPGNDDELNILQKGRNYGWPNVEGFCDEPGETAFCNDSNVVEPLKAWTPTLAVSAIAYYNHPMFPALQNSILMTTLKDEKLYELELNGSYDAITNSNVISQVSGDRLRAICIDPDGRIYISTSNSPASGTGAKVDKIIEIYDPTYSSIAQQLKKNKEVVAVYPNPARDEINIYNNIPRSKGGYKYAIFNLSGQEISGNDLQSGHNKVSVSSLPAGAYLLKVFNGLEQVSSTQFRKL